MIKAVIIDDEKKAKTSLVDDLAVYCPDIKIIGEAGDVRSGLELILKAKPELVFLDVEMPDGTGFDLLKQFAKKEGGIDKIMFHIIFTTAHDEYAIRAIKFSALDYLMKPVNPDELLIAVRKIKSISAGHSNKVNMDVLLEHNSKGNQPKKIVLNTMDSAFIYSIDEIVRCEAQRNYTLFHFKDGKSLLVSTTLGEYEGMLTEYGFFRIHHSHLVNLSCIKKFVKTEGYITMSDGMNAPVAQRKKEQFVKLLSSF